jgi:hypothetical protein
MKEIRPILKKKNEKVECLTLNEINFPSIMLNNICARSLNYFSLNMENDELFIIYIYMSFCTN